MLLVVSKGQNRHARDYQRGGEDGQTRVRFGPNSLPWKTHRSCRCLRPGEQHGGQHQRTL